LGHNPNLIQGTTTGFVIGRLYHLISTIIAASLTLNLHKNSFISCIPSSGKDQGASVDQ